jgi:hypothetical protein
MDANVLKCEFDQYVRQRFRVMRDNENLFVRQRVCVVAKQFSTPCDGDRFQLLFRAVRYVHSAPREREWQSFVLAGWRAPARLCFDAPMSMRARMRA